MKAIRILLSVVGVALTSIAFGQLLSQQDGGILFYTVSYHPANNRLEHYLKEYPPSRSFGDRYEVPREAITYFKPMESEIPMESWMTESFETGAYEADLALESWMTEPFEANAFEAELTMESWMAEPFETNPYEAELTMESWMAEPFQTNPYEAELAMESWMTRPFEVDEELEMEEWMSSSWF